MNDQFKVSTDTTVSPALEREVYNKFWRQHVAFSIGHIPGKITHLADIKLPNNSVLHQFSRMQTPFTTDVYPDPDTQLIKNETFNVFMRMVNRIPETGPFSVSERVQYIPSKYVAGLTKFFHENPHMHRTLNVDATVRRPNILNVFDYNNLLAAKIVGSKTPLMLYRRVDMWLRSILDEITRVDATKYHFIEIPLSNRVYNKAQVDRVLQKYNQSNVKHFDDPSYYILLHFIGWVASSFQDKQVATERLEGLIDDATYKVALEGDIYSKEDSYSLFHKLPQDKLEYIHLVFSCHGLTVTYNLQQLINLNKSRQFWWRVLNHINKLKLVAAGLATEETLDDKSDSEIDAIVSEHTVEEAAPLVEEISETPVADATPDKDTPKEDTSPSKVSKVVEEDSVDTEPLEVDTSNQPYVDSLVTVVSRNISNDKVSTPEVKEKAITLLEKSLAVSFDGETIHEVMNRPDPIITDNRLDHLQDDVIDPSMLQSTVIDFDKHYLKHTLKKQVAQVLSSFAVHGMYLTDIQVTEKIDELTKIEVYKAVYTDTNGKSHTVSFKLPIVSDDGTIMVNGIQSRMTAQMVNKPICKVSPTRVSLSSSYNKALVELLTSKAHSFAPWFVTYLNKLRLANQVNYTLGETTPDKPVAYEYAAIASRIKDLTVKDYIFTFDYFNRHTGIPDTDPARSRENDRLGIYCGRRNGNYLYFGKDNKVREISFTGETLSSSSIVDILISNTSGVPTPRMVAEWTTIKYLNYVLPIIFVLGYRYGLTNTLKKLGVKYRFVSRDMPKATKSPTDIVITFADGHLIFNRYPIKHSLIVAGLLAFETKEYSFLELDSDDAYYRMLRDNGMSMNLFKGIDSFFDLFVDPITRQVLISLGQPTTPAGLLIKATELLSDKHAIESSAVANLRMRGYERMPSMLYNTMARAMATYNAKKSGRKTFSINPEAVFMELMTDPTNSIVEELNPIHDIKSKTAITYAGAGGRTAQSFVVRDRVYPKDGVGVLSEATPDSGKVAINAYTSFNPVISDIYGTFSDVKDPNKLDPAQILSTTSLLVPGATQDDGKRTAMISIQASHQVPVDNGSVNRVRTGFEKVIAHRTSETFASVAKDNGKVIDVDDTLKVIRVQYDPVPVVPAGVFNAKAYDNIHGMFTTKTEGAVIRTASDAKGYVIGQTYSASDNLYVKVTEILMFSDATKIPDFNKLPKTIQDELIRKTKMIPAEKIAWIRLTRVPTQTPGSIDLIKYGDAYTSVSGSHIRQPKVANVKVGEVLKKGDVIAYNKGFFIPEFGSKQVAWKHGVMATVAFVDSAITHEDSCMISSSLGEKMRMNPAHVRTITIKKNSVIHSIVKVGDEVQTTDRLCIIEDGDLDTIFMSSGNPETIEFLADLNRKAIKAQYHGKIAEINVHYGCPINEMHPSVATLVQSSIASKKKLAKLAQGTLKSKEYLEPQVLPPGTKYKGVDFDSDTVVILITITESIPLGKGDKIVLNSASKSVIGAVMTKQAKTVDGLPIDIIFGGSSAMNRIINSIWINGIGNLVMAKAEKDILEIWKS